MLRHRLLLVIFFSLFSYLSWAEDASPPPPDLYDQAVLAESKGDLAAARAALARQVDMHPGDMAALRALARVQAKVGAWDDVVRALAAYLRLAEDDRAAREDYALALDRLGRKQEAEQERERAHTYEPVILILEGQAGSAPGPAASSPPQDKSRSSLHQRYFQAIDLKRKGERVAAMVALEAILVEEPQYGPALYSLGILYRDLSRHDDSGRVLEQALARNPGYGPGWLSLGLTRYRQGDLPAAEAAFLRALAVDSSLAEAHGSLGVVWRRMKRPEDAAAELRRALVLDPESWRHRSNLALTVMDLGHLTEAETLLREAVARAPDAYEPTFTLGSCLRRQERYPEAIAFYRKAVGMRPDAPDPHWDLAHLLAATGDTPAAVGEMRQFIALTGNGPSMDSALKKIAEWEKPR